MKSTIWLECDITAYSLEAELDAASNVSTAEEIRATLLNLEGSCPPMYWSRVGCYAAFLINSICLFFSFVRHHIKYERNPFTQGIETERHRVVVALAFGCFARALCFIVDPDFWPSDVHDSSVKVAHIVFRVLKDILFVYAFSLVVVFWNMVLRTLKEYSATPDVHKWSEGGWWVLCRSITSNFFCKTKPTLVHSILVTLFALIRVSIAIARLSLVNENDETSSDTSFWDYTFYSVLLFIYGGLIFPAFLVSGIRLQSRLRAVGRIVRRNLARVRAFMLLEFIFSICLVVSTLLRLILFDSRRVDDAASFSMFFILKVLTKMFEVCMVTTLSMLMIARNKKAAPKYGHSGGTRKPSEHGTIDGGIRSNGSEQTQRESLTVEDAEVGKVDGKVLSKGMKDAQAEKADTDFREMVLTPPTLPPKSSSDAENSEGNRLNVRSQTRSALSGGKHATYEDALFDRRSFIKDGLGSASFSTSSMSRQQRSMSLPLTGMPSISY